MYKSSDSSATLIMIGILIVILLFLTVVRSCSSSTAYNNGICPICGGAYVFKETVGHRYSTNYIYICNKCGHLIESSIYFTSVAENK